MKALEGAARVVRHWGLWVIIAVVLGALLGNFVFHTVIGSPSIGIIRINTLLYPWTVPDIVKMVKYAEETRDIKAIVLEVDSPGGEAVSTEELYLTVMQLRKKKPVVAYINMISASGAFYTSVAANYIYAKPSSLVGNVGAWVSMPEQEPMYEDITWTGPNKITGGSRGEAVSRLEMLKEGFLQAVVSQRGERLKTSREEISKGGLYSGIEGVRYGLIDDIGSSSDAIKKAAELGGLRNYGVIDINKKLEISQFSWLFGSFEGNAGQNTEASKLRSSMMPTYYYLYTPPEAQK